MHGSWFACLWLYVTYKLRLFIVVRPAKLHLLTQLPAKLHLLTQLPAKLHLLTQLPAKLHLLTQLPAELHLLTQLPAKLHLQTKLHLLTQLTGFLCYQMLRIRSENNAMAEHVQRTKDSLRQTDGVRLSLGLLCLMLGLLRLRLGLQCWDSCISEWDSCVSGWDSCISEWDSCVSGWDSCISEWDSCVSEWDYCVSGWDSCVSGWDSCISEWDSCVSEWDSCCDCTKQPQRLCGATMRRTTGAMLLLPMLFLMGHTEGTRYGPPGKPKLTSCRSPEKETFTCWWEPGADGGLPTIYSLYYRKENSDTVYECPDYRTAGENSCFFNKNDTSIWVNYNITVVAANALGSNFSDPVDVDVVYIVQPHTPENVTVVVMEDKDEPFLRISWEPPRKADTRSGWITLIYELRVKLEGKEEWEEHRAGQQKIFNIFSLRSGGTYLVQVRCRPDHGFWSEWSSTTYITVPYYIPREKSLWILILTFSAVIFLFLTWMFNLKSQRVKHCLLPPVPRPKIRGFDSQLIKDGRSEEVFYALVVSGFPPTTYSDYEELLVEYLDVYTPDEQELMLEEGKDLQGGCLKPKGSPSDSDSGRGSCDSHTLLMEKCGEAEAKGEGGGKELEGGRKGKPRHQAGWAEAEVRHGHEEVVSPEMSGGRVKTWPSLFSPLPQYSSRPLHHQDSLETTKQLCLSDSLFPPPSTSLHPTQPGYSTKESLALGPDHWGFRFGNKKQSPPHRYLQARSDLDISSTERQQVAPGLPLPPPPFLSTEYVEVQMANPEDVVLLQPLSSSGCGQGLGHHPQTPRGENYSKVRGVDGGNVLLLQREVEVMEEEGDGQEGDGATESCYTMSTATTTQMTGKPTVCSHSATPLQEEMVLAANGYVDTRPLFGLLDIRTPPDELRPTSSGRRAQANELRRTSSGRQMYGSSHITTGDS
ncbi:prolactin receptor a [Diretmus argenteus]